MPTADLLVYLSSISTTVIVAVFGAHLFLMLILKIWASWKWSRISSMLDDFTRKLSNRSILDRHAHKSDQIDAFLADVGDVLEDPSRDTDRRTLLMRISVLDEKRYYLGSLAFETVYNLCRSMIEAYPLAGVLGTVLAIGSTLQQSSTVSAEQTLNNIVSRFGDSIWSTFAGLSAAIVLMFLNSLLEPNFVRLTELQQQVRLMIGRVKRELSMSHRLQSQESQS